MQAAGAPEAVIAGEVVEASRHELEGGDFWGVENCEERKEVELASDSPISWFTAGMFVKT